MGVFFNDMSQAQIAGLGSKDVMAVIMVHECPRAMDGYEEHLLNHLIPKVSFSGMRVHSRWGADPLDADFGYKIVEDNGYLNSVFHGTITRVNAGHGLTSIVIIMRRHNVNSG